MASEVLDASGPAVDPGPRIQPREDSLVRPERAPVLVLGLGNLLLKDDGVGLELLRRLRDRWRAERPQAPEVELDRERLIALLQSNDTAELRDWLQKQLVTLGLRTFIHRLMAPATRAVGKAWEEGRLQVHQEHLYTELVKGLIRALLRVLDPRSQWPLSRSFVTISGAGMVRSKVRRLLVISM